MSGMIFIDGRLEELDADFLLRVLGRFRGPQGTLTWAKLGKAQLLADWTVITDQHGARHLRLSYRRAGVDRLLRLAALVHVPDDIVRVDLERLVAKARR